MLSMRRALDDGFELDDDPARLDIDAVHAFISTQSYWGRGRSRELVASSIAGSTRVIGLYRAQQQVGFARVICDGATVGYLADVYVLEHHRGRGLGRQLISEALDGGPRWDVHWLLHTVGAEQLYAKFGFTDTAEGFTRMERARAR
jgi:GNAT superfamily N-acetyltransferase